MNNSEMEIRARRFPLRLPLRFRVTGTSDWHPGQTENISCSGVLFRCRHRLEPAVPVEVMLQLPGQICGEAPLKVVCGGYVTRLIPPDSPQARPAVAAAFVDFRLVYANHHTQARLRQAERERRRKPGADLAHGLNSALAVILGNCEMLLERTELQNEPRKALLRIKEAAQRATKLVSEL
jgi:signal transduction histidine kinase